MLTFHTPLGRDVGEARATGLAGLCVASCSPRPRLVPAAVPAACPRHGSGCLCSCPGFSQCASENNKQFTVLKIVEIHEILMRYAVSSTSFSRFWAVLCIFSRSQESLKLMGVFLSVLLRHAGFCVSDCSLHRPFLSLSQFHG